MVQTAPGYSATATIGVTMKAAAATAPAITEAGVVNGASFASGIAAGSWVAIFGQNLAAGTRALTSDDLVNGNMPTSLGGVSVNVNSQAAFLYYVSPTQINLLAPADSNTGAVSVTVTNSAGNVGGGQRDPAGGGSRAVRVERKCGGGTGRRYGDRWLGRGGKAGRDHRTVRDGFRRDVARGGPGRRYTRARRRW